MTPERAEEIISQYNRTKRELEELKSLRAKVSKNYIVNIKICVYNKLGEEKFVIGPTMEEELKDFIDKSIKSRQQIMLYIVETFKKLEE